jgi:hypothetical protein
MSLDKKATNIRVSTDGQNTDRQEKKSGANKVHLLRTNDKLVQ